MHKEAIIDCKLPLELERGSLAVSKATGHPVPPPHFLHNSSYIGYCHYFEALKYMCQKAGAGPYLICMGGRVGKVTSCS